MGTMGTAGMAVLAPPGWRSSAAAAADSAWPCPPAALSTALQTQSEVVTLDCCLEWGLIVPRLHSSTAGAVQGTGALLAGVYCSAQGGTGHIPLLLPC